MFSATKPSRGLRRSRRGAIVALIGVSLPMLVMLCAYAVDVAYMELVRAQLRISADSAAKAALIYEGSGQTQTAAITFAQTVANNNLVAGQQVAYSSSNILFGNAVKNGSGVYVFTSGGTPTNSVQATGTVTPALLLGAYLPVSNFTTQQVSTATRISHDIMLVLDRSASMAFDLSANEFVYPPDVSTNRTQLQCYFTPPSATASRWAALTSAVNSFVNALTARNLDVHVGLVTYAETYSFGNYSATEATLDVTLTPTYSSIITAMNNYGTNGPLLGDTNISAGLALAQTELTGSDARTSATDRTIILLTDGVATQGNTNIASLTQSYAQNSGIVTHVITFGGEAGSGTVQAAMQQAATNGNGNFYNAPTAATLTQAFQDIADSLPAVLVQ
jgi:Flp pilus assembly protein TadG